MVATLEREAAAMIGTRFALGVTSGSAALEVALAALGVGPGDEVIVPAWSWVSCFTSIVRVGGKPVLGEINETLCLAPGEITRLRTPRTKAVLVVHFQGVAAELDQLVLSLSRSLQITFVVVTHELPSIFTIADRVIMLDKQEKGIIAMGNPQQLRDQSPDPRVRQFFTRQGSSEG